MYYGELIDEICHWLELSDTAYNYISKNSLLDAQVSIILKVSIINAL